MKKRSVVVSGHATSVTIEDAFWQELQAIAKARNLSLAALISEIDARRGAEATQHNLSSAIRLYVLGWVKGA